MFAKDGPTLFELICQALASTRKGYDMLAPKFDLTPFRTADAVLEPSIQVIGPIDSALDVCCGTGAAMEFLAPICRERLSGIDFSPGMLQQAEHNLTQGPHAVIPGKQQGEEAGNTAASSPLTLELIEGDVLTMYFTQKFDVVTCFGALGHILPRDQRTFVRRIHEALKPGGRFVFVSGYPPPLFSFVSLVLRAFNLVMVIRNALIKPPFIMYYLTFLLPQAQQLLEEEGFQVQVYQDLFAAPYQAYCLVIATRIP